MLASLKQKIASSLRYKLLSLLLAPFLLVAPLTVGFVVNWSHDFSQGQLLRRVSTDLAVAHASFVRLQEDHLNRLQRLADSHAFYTSFERGDARRIQDQLAAVRQTTSFDFLNVTDLRGQRIFGGSGGGHGVSKTSPLRSYVTTWGRPSVGIEIYSHEDLLEEDVDLADEAALTLVPTPRAAPSDRSVEDRAMVIRAIVPVRNPKGSIVALVDGGVVLNRSFGLVDGIRNLVYAPDSLPRGSTGTVSVVLDDVRISTNVPGRPAQRALGTRVSADVRESVLERGNTWVDYAFVVDDWYISAYEPIIDVYGERVGMLHTGFLEAPFRHAYYRTLGVALMLLLLGIGFAALVVVRGAKTVFQPVEAIASAVRAVRAGEEQRIGDVASSDELGELARQFDKTLNLLKLRNEEIRNAAERLESKVEERTRELKEKNQRLEETIEQLHETRQQLVEAEKLAALGQLTAGVAHEINNPIAVIQGNLELVRQQLGARLVPVQTEMDLIMEQIARIHAIVDKLLRYSRPSVCHDTVENVDLRALVTDTLVLVEHECSAKSTRIETTHAATRPVAIHPQELQQVLVNLLVNAVHASEPGDVVEVSTRDRDEDGVVIAVRDRGSGIEPEHLARIFDPFFTTKKVGGTGLGLSVSYGLIRQYGGDVKVSSQKGEGTTFEVHLRGRPVATAAAERPSRPGEHGPPGLVSTGRSR